MIYIDDNALLIAGEIAEGLTLRKVAHEVQPLAKVEKENSRDQVTLVCGIRANSKGLSSEVQKLTEAAVKKGMQRLVIVNQSSAKPEFQSLKNGRLKIISADFESQEFSSEFIVSMIVSLISEGQGCVIRDPASIALYQMADRVAQSDVGVFINGPTGTGKEVLSNFLHDQSKRKNEKFLALNCAAIPDHMLEAMLFGHLKGAFTGAASHSKGIFRAADKGTLLLDEISEMPLSLQAKLLRMLQERAVTPVGGTEAIPCDVRVIATSNRDMGLEVREGRFREDLYYRLNVFPLVTLPLAERKDDIIPLSAHMLLRHSQNHDELPFLTTAAASQLKKHHWPGNVRELENVIQRATVLSAGHTIDVPDILINAEPLAAQILPGIKNQLNELRA